MQNDVHDSRFYVPLLPSLLYNSERLYIYSYMHDFLPKTATYDFFTPEMSEKQIFKKYCLGRYLKIRTSR